SEAYGVLGLEKGADIEAVKKAYKSQALQHHPDYVARKMGVHLDQVPAHVKAEATTKFQQIGESYEVLTAYLEDPHSRGSFDPDDELYGRGPAGFGPGSPFFSDFFFGGGPFYRRGGGDSDDDDDIDDESLDYDDDDEEEGMHNFAEFLFYMFMRSEGRQPPRTARSQYEARSKETPEQKARRRAEERVRGGQSSRAWREREMRQRAEDARIERERMERLKAAEAEAAATRRKAKANAKNAEWQAAKAKAIAEKRQALARRQATRTTVFEAARRGDSAAVKRGVRDDFAIATGGEIFNDEVKFDMNSKPKDWDRNETLLHIAVEKGDKGLVSWLLENGTSTG
ncbi:hypothetical protein FRC03_007542, partial [Tulasnella sp. 419]